MATIRLNIPDAQLARLLRANAKHRGYQETVPDPNSQPDGTMPNPQTRRQFVEARIIDFLMEPLESDEADEAARAAAKAAREKARAEVVITVN